MCWLHVRELNHQPEALLYLLSVSLGISSRCEQSQDGCQETLVDLHCHLLNQSHEVPEVYKHLDDVSRRQETVSEDRQVYRQKLFQALQMKPFEAHWN